VEPTFDAAPQLFSLQHDQGKGMPIMKVALAADHAGFELKESLRAFLPKLGVEVIDLGTDRGDVPSDYPDFARRIGESVVSGQAERGILVCGSGVGASIAANKVRGVYAALCHDTYSAHQGVEQDKMNVLCLGARIIGVELAREIVKSYLGAQFSAEDRHIRRTNKIKALEEGTPYPEEATSHS
jgi:ribose 5-phosphate isomerase B